MKVGAQAQPKQKPPSGGFCVSDVVISTIAIYSR
jgi:hypothetical protein